MGSKWRDPIHFLLPARSMRHARVGLQQLEVDLQDVSRQIEAAKSWLLNVTPGARAPAIRLVWDILSPPSAPAFRDEPLLTCRRCRATTWRGD